MTLGYDGKLYILAFDHRGSFQTKMFGIEGDPTPAETETIRDAKKLIFEGMEKVVERGSDPAVTGVLVDEQFGGDIPELAKELGLTLARPIEKSGLSEFDFQYGDAFAEHIEADDADFSKVLVRLNPDGDAETNARQLDRLKRLADWLHDHDRKFLFELLVPAEPDQLAAVGGDSNRYDAELRPELMRRAIEQIHDHGIDVDVWKIEGVDAREDAEMLIKQTRDRRGPRARHLRAAGPRRVGREGRPLAPAGGAGGGLHRLRHRALDLVGRAEGLPRRRPRARRRLRPDRGRLPALREGLRRRRARGPRLTEEDRGLVEKGGADGLRLGDGLAERNEIDDVTLEGDHRPEGVLVHGADGP